MRLDAHGLVSLTSGSIIQGIQRTALFAPENGRMLYTVLHCSSTMAMDRYCSRLQASHLCGPTAQWDW